MPEGSKDASILIATSWQALDRVDFVDSKTVLCDCIVVILFAGFFIEANLNLIVKELHMETNMKTFVNNNPYPGLQDKLAWFYNQFIARKKASTVYQSYKKFGIKKKLRRKFRGFGKIYNFRNDISHGTINKSAFSLEKTKELRQDAKNIVDCLFSVVSKHGYKIPRDITYTKAISQIT